MHLIISTFQTNSFSLDTQHVCRGYIVVIWSIITAGVFKTNVFMGQCVGGCGGKMNGMRLLPKQLDQRWPLPRRDYLHSDKSGATATN